MKQKELIPATVLTGFLGAGKTTLLNRLLSQNHGYKCAIIINEFGAISIDNQLVIGADEEIIELSNGCLCCRVRADLIKCLTNLFQKQKRFDYVLIETTGLADPGPVAQTFGMKDLADKLRLDAVVTVADARHLEKELLDSPEASAQIAFADVVLLNKMDLVGQEDLDRVEARIRRMNSLALIHRTQGSEIEFGKILNIKARHITAPLVVSGARKIGLTAHRDHAPATGDQHGHREEVHEHHHHDDAVTSIYFREERPLDLPKLEQWLGDVINTLGPTIYRSKGILHIKGQAKRVVFHGVQMMFESAPDRLWNVAEKRESQLVFIGKDLNETKIREGFDACIAM
ncbi:MAG: GTP-binding protein [Pedosphaera sp.]|nr:GTP-binding protein [Pedosphaera sp.]